MPLGRLGRMSWCLGPVSMIIPPAFVMHGRRVFDVHLFHSLLGKSNLAVIPANPLCNVCPHQLRNEDGYVKLAHDSLKQSQ